MPIHSKGSPIGSPILTNLVVPFPNLEKSAFNWLCSYCHTPTKINTSSDEKIVDTSISSSGRSESKIEDRDAADANISFKCRCGRSYCCADCQSQDITKNGHWLTCDYSCTLANSPVKVEPSVKANHRTHSTSSSTWTKSRALMRFKKHAVSSALSVPVPWLALHALAHVIAHAALSGNITTNSGYNSNVFHESVQLEMNEYLKASSSPGIAASQSFEDVFDSSESWTLLQTLLRGDKRFLPLSVEMDADNSPVVVDIGSTVADIVCESLWRRLLLVSSRRALAFDIESPYHILAKSLPSLVNPVEVECALKILERVLDVGDKFCHLYHPSESSYRIVSSSVPKYFHGTKQHFSSYGIYGSDPISASLPATKRVKIDKVNVLVDENRSVSALMRDRLVMRLAYMANHHTYYTEETNPFDKLVFSGYALCTESNIPAHSCAPCAVLDFTSSATRYPSETQPPHELSEQVTHADLSQRANNSFGSKLQVQVVAQYDLFEEDEVSVDRFGTSGRDLDGRHEILRTRLCDPEYVCLCLRCEFERNSIKEGYSIFTPRQLCLIAAGYSQEGALHQARNIYQYLLQDSTTEYLSTSRTVPLIEDQRLGDVYHALGASYLDFSGVSVGEVNWSETHRIWQRGHAAVPGHDRLRDAVSKLRHYRPFCCKLSPSMTSKAASLVADDYYCVQVEGAFPSIYLSKEPVLTPEECRGIITDAERAANQGAGWTTARHYAVPTTDIPVHSLPRVLAKFNALVQDRIGPMLCTQFSPSFTNGRCQTELVFEVHVHDAFIVKYQCPHSPSGNSKDVKSLDSRTAAFQRYLPLHTDQSTHSLTIALNPVDEYEGGGTYFLALDDSLRPDMGQILSFQGDLYHAGEPILRGTRYIIAAFLLLRCHSVTDEIYGPLYSTEHSSNFKMSKTCENNSSDSNSTFLFDFSV